MPSGRGVKIGSEMNYLNIFGKLVCRWFINAIPLKLLNLRPWSDKLWSLVTLALGHLHPKSNPDKNIYKRSNVQDCETMKDI